MDQGFRIAKPQSYVESEGRNIVDGGLSPEELASEQEQSSKESLRLFWTMYIAHGILRT